MTGSLQATDSAAAASAVGPRVALADIEAEISGVYYTTGFEAADGVKGEHVEQLMLLTLCLVVMKNGFTVVGKSAPASAVNFNAELGRKFAYEDCIRQLWPLMGFALRDKIAAGPGIA